MKNTITKLLVTIGAILFFNINALAVEPATFKMGALDLVPTLGIDYSDTDNMFKSSSNEVDSTLLLISPSIQAVYDNGHNTFSGLVEADDGNFSATSVDDYTDWRVAGDVHLEMNSRNAFELDAGLFSTREMRGTGFSQGGLLPAQPDEYEETTAGFSYLYGDSESFFSFVLNADAYDKEYDNNREQTQYRDRKDDDLSGIFYFNGSPRTNLFFEYRYTDVDYTTDPIPVDGVADSLDSEETYIFVGLSWAATAKTTGSIQVGQGDKKFDDADRRDADGSVWEASLLWEPLTYSAISFDAVNGYDEATGVGDAMETENYKLTWVHAWSDSLSHSVNLYTADEVYLGSDRTDDFDTMSLRLDYSVRRWIDVNVSVAREERESSFSAFEYKENVISLGFSMSL